MSAWVVLGLVIGIGCLVAGAELLVKGAAAIATKLGVQPVVIGLTVVAFGTSAPELAVSVGSGLSGNADVAFGNVAGSNIVNILLILGTSAVVGGLAVDADVTDPRTLQWMKTNGPRFGWVEAVPREPWHWEFRPGQV